MEELIRNEAASAPLPFDGERLTAAASGQVVVEHYHRYLLAREFCRGRDVLDIACGEGYGAALLSQVARAVVGVDNVPSVIEAARAEFARPNLRYETGDARAIPLADGSVDVVVCFETLEHITEHDLFLTELRRVLRPGGLVVISTPDRDSYRPSGTPPNPFHLRELSRDEFDTLLRRHFSHAAYAAQRALIGSAIVSEGESAPLRAYDRRSNSVIHGRDGLPAAPYLIALASDAALPVLPHSVYLFRGDLDTDPQARADAESARRVAEQERDAAAARSAAAEQGRLAAEARADEEKRQAATSIEQLGIDVARERAEKERAEHSVREIAGRLRDIETSSIWRATAAPRRIGGRFPRIARALRMAGKLAWWTLTLQIGQRFRGWRTRNDTPARLPPGLPAPPPLEALSSGPIRIATSNTPDVSIVICTYGHVGYTLDCLRSIADHPPACAVEVLVVDDAFPDVEAVRPLGEVEGIALSRNAANLGFLRSCNHAARSARGRYLYLLNNDTRLQAGAIDALVELLDARPDVGIAGSKLMFPDGRLQEAGGIVWDDASAWNEGFGDVDPTRPEFSYPREVDYCSGASLMIHRGLFESLGGFDEAFAPAYYEDTDLAFRVRARGLKVLYEPRSVVLHHGGVSHGTDPSASTKAHQNSNQAVFFARWRTQLAAEHYRNGEHVIRARERGRQRKLILVIDHYVPEPDRDAGSKSMMGVLDSLVDAGWIVKFWPHNRAWSPLYTPALEQRGIEVVDRRWPGDLAAWLRVYGAELDHVLVSRPDVAEASLPHLVNATDATLSYYGHDLHFARMRRQADLTGDGELYTAAHAMEQLERRLWRHFDVVIYLSDDEAETVRMLSPGRLACSIVPYAFETALARSVPAAGTDVLFVAGFAHPPNVDAAEFLVREVMPRLRNEIGPVRLTLAGSNPTRAVRALAGRNVVVTGSVSEAELVALYATHRVAVVPLRFGAGVKGKVVEALSQGLPLVTTSTGAQGIDGLGDIVPVRDDAAGIVAALKRLVQDDGTWMAQSLAQTRFVQRRFSARAMQDSLLAALAAGEASAGRGTSAPGPSDGVTQVQRTGHGRGAARSSG